MLRIIMMLTKDLCSFGFHEFHGRQAQVSDPRLLDLVNDAVTRGAMPPHVAATRGTCNAFVILVLPTSRGFGRRRLQVRRSSGLQYLWRRCPKGLMMMIRVGVGGVLRLTITMMVFFWSPAVQVSSPSLITGLLYHRGFVVSARTGPCGCCVVCNIIKPVVVQLREVILVVVLLHQLMMCSSCIRPAAAMDNLLLSRVRGLGHIQCFVEISLIILLEFSFHILEVAVVHHKLVCLDRFQHSMEGYNHKP